MAGRPRKGPHTCWERISDCARDIRQAVKPITAPDSGNYFSEALSSWVNGNGTVSACARR
jgi:hypothetical protein